LHCAPASPASAAWSSRLSNRSPFVLGCPAATDDRK
jgi:hypothetical protein